MKIRKIISLIVISAVFSATASLARPGPISTFEFPTVESMVLNKDQAILANYIKIKMCT